MSKRKQLVVESTKEKSFVVDNLSDEKIDIKVPDIKKEKLNLVEVITNPILSQEDDSNNNSEKGESSESVRDKKFQLKRMMFKYGNKELTEQKINNFSEKQLDQELELMRYRITDRQNAALTSKALDVVSYGVGYPLDIQDELREEIANDKELQAIVNEKLTFELLSWIPDEIKIGILFTYDGISAWRKKAAKRKSILGDKNFPPPATTEKQLKEGIEKLQELKANIDHLKSNGFDMQPVINGKQ